LHYDSNKVILGNFFLIFQPFSRAWIANAEFTLSLNKHRTAVDIWSVSLNLMINLSGLILSKILLQQYKYHVHKVPAYMKYICITSKIHLVFLEKFKQDTQRALERSPETEDFKEFLFFIALCTTGDTWEV